MKHLIRLTAVIFYLMLTACGGGSSAPSDKPANFAVTEGENRVVLTWDSKPGLTYWVFYKEGTKAGLDDYDNIIKGIKTPYILTGLTNGTQYAFTITASKDNSEAGPFSQVITAIPRLIGPDTTWTVGTPLTTENLNGIVFDGSHYVAVGNAAKVFTAPYDYASEGGVTEWTEPATLPTAADLTGVVHDGSRFVALGSDGSIIKSTDTIDWEAGTAIAGVVGMNAIAYGNGIYVAVGDGGVIHSNVTAGVTDDWTERTSGTLEDLYGVAYVNGQFIATGSTGTLLTSTDAVTWTSQDSDTLNALRHVTYSESMYIAVGDAGTVVSSADAITWTAQTLPTTESLYSVCHGPNGRFYAVGTAGVVIYSDDGTDGSWSEAFAGSIDLKSIAPNFVYIAVGDAGANVSGR